MPGMCSECMADVHGAESYPMVSWAGSAWPESMELNHILWSRGVTASTLDPESSDRGSNLWRPSHAVIGRMSGWVVMMYVNRVHACARHVQ